VTVVGELPNAALAAWPEAVTRRVVVTGERRVHYLERHPEVAGDEGVLGQLIVDPDEIHRYKGDPRVANLYRRIDGDRWWMAGVLISARGGLQNSILSFRRANRLEIERGRKQGRLLWEKQPPGGSAGSRIPLAEA
jgi:hypothetical protein